MTCTAFAWQMRLEAVKWFLRDREINSRIGCVHIDGRKMRRTSRLETYHGIRFTIVHSLDNLYSLNGHDRCLAAQCNSRHEIQCRVSKRPLFLHQYKALMFWMLRQAQKKLSASHGHDPHCPSPFPLSVDHAFLSALLPLRYSVSQQQACSY
jgi:hypothetical protein